MAKRTVLRAAALGALGLVVAGVSSLRVRFLPEVAIPPSVVAAQLADFSSAPLKQPLGLLFLHHAIGGQLLVDPSDHENGGGARRLLTESGYLVHTATFGSKFGQNNYTFDWLPKFANHTDELLRIEEQDRELAEPLRNRVVIFKSCFENSLFVGEGIEPGNPSGPDLTLANAKAVFRQMLPIFKSRPDTLFVFMTTPPHALERPEMLWKSTLKRVSGKPLWDQQQLSMALLARRFHDWVVAEDGWLGPTAPKNVAVFDYYDILTKHGSSLFLAYPTGDGTNSHPSSEANRIAAHLFVPFLNRAVRRAGISD